uniref:Uncharacterized protein n=1 Tax=Anguilla anguilla TaxID=7936 RepID=A0A0E9XR51_ANGAN
MSYHSHPLDNRAPLSLANLLHFNVSF